MKNEITLAVSAFVYLAVAIGLTILNMFVEMPMVGQLMLMYAPAVFIIGYIIYLVAMLFAKESH